MKSGRPDRLAAMAERRGDPDALLVIDALAGVLRAFGDAFDIPGATVEQTRAKCDRWARHALVGSPVADDAPPAGVVAARDWNGLLQFVAGQRRAERDYVVPALADMRQVIATFVQGLGFAVREEADEESRTREQLDRLRSALQADSLADLKREAQATVSLVSELADRRQKRRTRQSEDMAEQVRRLGERLEVAERESGTDPLTGLANRRTFEQHLERASQLSAAFGGESCLLLVDVDHFKAVNDELGHPAGDAALRELAKCLIRTFPRKGDCVARFGGEEFAILLRDATLADGQRLAERLRVAVRTLVVYYEGHEIRLTISIGLCEIEAGQPKRTFERADRALYAAKRGGRDQVVVGKPGE
jgi:diguanylate cyclase (GGDEF)-like protein